MGAFELQSRSFAKVCVGLSAGLQSNQGGVVKCEDGNLKTLNLPFKMYLIYELQEDVMKF